ncbi:MAG: agmatinase [Desulfobacteraceae bacterium]|nr:agmatinase [Desulfobacteraceae bacterium]
MDDPSPEAFKSFGEDEIEIADFESARIVVLPICYENDPADGRSGSRNGAFHILNISRNLESFDEETMTDWGLAGIHTLNPLIPSGEPEQAVLQMKKAAKEVLARKKSLLCIGGDHAVSIGPVMAAAELYPDVGVLQIDAHLDLRDEWNGNRFNHACVMRRIADDINLDIVQVGIRSFSAEEAAYVRDRNLKPFYAHEIYPWDNSWIEKVTDALPEKVYITVDLDGLDPSAVPGVSTPDPGGLSYRQVSELIKAVGKKKKVVAADINELVKIRGTHVSELTAARIATKIFVFCFNETFL